MNKRHTIITLLSLAAGLGCGGDEKDATIATVNGREITRAQFEAFLELKRIPREDERRREQSLNEYLEREALADAIEQEKTLPPALVEAELREFEKELLISRYFDKVLADKVNDEAIRSYYGQNAAKYEEKKIHVAHILIRVSPRMSEEERKAKLTAAQEVHSKLQAGEDFAAVAQALSEDKISGQKGGDLGFLREGSVDPRFSKKVFAMKQGEVSEPFETSFGFHIVKVIEAAVTAKKPLEAVQGDIRYQLRAAAKKAEMERLAAKAKVERKGAAKSGGKDEKPGSERADETKQATAKRD
jgi:peptidyl-prolyl cis-trans isomerase C